MPQKYVSKNSIWIDLNRHFTKEDTEMAPEQFKRCPISLFIRKIQIKAITRYRYPHEWLKFFLKLTTLHVGRTQSDLNSHTSLMIQSLREKVSRSLVKLDMHLPSDPATAVLGM